MMPPMHAGRSLWVSLTLLLALIAGCSAKDRVRVLFLTDCTIYSDWQSIGMVYSYMYSGHDGPITRVMCCTDAERKKYNPEMLNVVETHIAPSLTVHPRTGDVYAAYNKPEAVIDYMEKNNPPEEYIVVLDSDMVLRMRFSTADYKVSKGWAAGARYEYMIGVNNKLADKHIPEIPKRNDTFAGPLGRRSDMVGGFFFIQRDDLKALSKLWLKYTEDVRADPEAWKYSGDMYATKPGIKPWISEMYGYSFGAAKANVWHHWDDYTMLYPGYTPGGVPRVLHYGLEWDIPGTDYKYDKHWFTNFDVYQCPSWDLGTDKPQAGLFPHPPRPSELRAKTFVDRYRDLIATEAAATLNAGLCWWHKQRCKDVNDQMKTECEKADQIFFEVKEALKLAESVFDCIDFKTECPKWSSAGECKHNKAYMEFHCKASCNICKPKPEAQYPRILDLLSSVKGEKLQPQAVTKPKAAAPTLDASDSEKQIESLRGSGQALHKKREPTDSHKPHDSTSDHNTDEPTAKNLETKAGEKVEDVKPEPVLSPPVVEKPAEEPVEKPAEKPVQEPAKIPVDTQHTGDGGTTDRNVVTDDLIQHKEPHELKQLLKRCYRKQSLTIDEVKACVAAAKQGQKWEKVVAPAHLALGDHDANIKGFHTISKAKRDITSASINPTTSSHSTKSGLESALSWQTISIWGVVLTGMLYTVPKYLRARKRARSGMRAE